MSCFINKYIFYKQIAFYILNKMRCYKTNFRICEVKSMPTYNAAFDAFEYNDKVEKTVPYYNEFFKQIIDIVDVLEFKDIDWLDIGCGTGKMAEAAYNYFNINEFAFCDVSEEMLNITRERFKNKNNRFFLMSAEEIEFCDKYDIVTSIMVNHYFNKTVRERVILNCYKALKKGGVLFSFENFAPNTGFGKSMQLKRWKKYQINNGKSENEAESHINRYRANYYPITISSQLDILKKCGFNKYETIWISGMQAGFMGIK